jgi:hypothetical protein
MTKHYFYPAQSTLDSLSVSCQIDEDTFRARLTNLEMTTADGAKANMATFQSIEMSEPYVSKNLAFQTESGSDQARPGYSLVFKARVFLNGEPTNISVYREL